MLSRRIKAVAILLGAAMVTTTARAAEPVEVAAGQRPPALTLAGAIPPDAPTDLAALRGDVVILEFWATWCGPCREAMPHLDALAERYKDQPVRAIAITAEDNGAVAAFLAKTPMRPTVALDAGGATFAAFGVRHIPTTVVIDRNGIVAAVMEPSLITNESIDALLAGRSIDPPRHVPPPAENKLAGVLPGDSQAVAPPVFSIAIRRAGHRFESLASDSNGTWTFASATPQRLYGEAYDLDPTRVVLDGALPEQYWDVAVRSPRMRMDDVMKMLPPALDASLGVRSRVEPREQDVFVLSRDGPLGVGLMPTTQPDSQALRNGDGEIYYDGNLPGWLPPLLQYRLKRPVIDETGLAGRFDVRLTWDATAAPDDAIPTAVRSQLGLRMERAKRTLDVVVLTPTTRP